MSGLEKKKLLYRKINNKHIIVVAISRTLKQLLMIDAFRYFVAYPRYLYFTKIRKKLRIYQNHLTNEHKHTISYNLRAISGAAVIRSNKIIKPLTAIDYVYNNLENLKVLSIGPRTEGEILNLVAHGFSLKKIKGIDLFSYSPWIEVGDMHNALYKENSFDVIISGWSIIGYSSNPEKAAKNILRVADDNAIICVGISYKPKELLDFRQKNLEKQYGESFLEVPRIESVQQILNLFGKSVNHVYFSQDVIDKNKEQNIVVIFSITKTIHNV